MLRFREDGVAYMSDPTGRVLDCSASIETACEAALQLSTYRPCIVARLRALGARQGPVTASALHLLKRGPNVHMSRMGEG